MACLNIVARIGAFILALAALIGCAAPQVATGAAGAEGDAANERAALLIERLQMQYLQGESGYFAVRPESEFVAPFDGAQRPIHSSIYYLLTGDKPVNYLHWLASEDIHILVEGGPLTYYIFHETGTVSKVRLGTNWAKGEVPVVTVPARSYKAIVLDEAASHGLMVNVLTPAWSPDRVKIGADQNFIDKYQGQADWATLGFLHSLFPVEH